jgi:hypothetical protein
MQQIKIFNLGFTMQDSVNEWLKANHDTIEVLSIKFNTEDNETYVLIHYKLKINKQINTYYNQYYNHEILD